jgi:hypothetical protein
VQLLFSRQCGEMYVRMPNEPQVAMTPAQQPAPVPPPNPHCERVEPVVWLLSVLTLIFTGSTVAVALFASTDGQTFQFLSNLASGFSGALLMKITGRGASAPSQPGGLPR